MGLKLNFTPINCILTRKPSKQRLAASQSRRFPPIYFLLHTLGLSQEELFLWLPVKDIIVNDPSSRLILFDIGVAHKQLSLSLFEKLPVCKPQDLVLERDGKNKMRFQAQR
ncbi:hypothetical protein F2P56_029283 [Juglans regia]|uniref:Uncharacterized protein LOC109012068 n=2 Tax=Juglans regia TaxID=51240 RepID=A0A2I4GYU3_JUGRE|nr:uncharacterized protein LOC109012068 [Juglans regia]KAF5448779.1 hypothetical protein F2P56_029283 [Juglans regia]